MVCLQMKIKLHRATEYTVRSSHQIEIYSGTSTIHVIRCHSEEFTP